MEPHGAARTWPAAWHVAARPQLKIPRAHLCRKRHGRKHTRYLVVDYIPAFVQKLAWNCLERHGAPRLLVSGRSRMDSSALVAEIASHAERIRRDGFTIIENVIPADVVASLKLRVEAAQRAIGEAGAALEPLLASGTGTFPANEPTPQEQSKGVLAEMDQLPDRVTGVGQPRSPEHRAALLDAAAAQLAADGVQSVYPPGTPTGDDNPGVNHIAFIPELAAYFADDRVVGVSKALLDVDVRIAQTEINKSVAPSPPNAKGGGGMYFGPRVQVSVHQWKTPDFLSRNPDFLSRNPDFLLKNDAFIIKQDLRHWHSDWPHDIGAGSSVWVIVLTFRWISPRFSADFRGLDGTGTHSGHISQPFSAVWELQHKCQFWGELSENALKMH